MGKLRIVIVDDSTFSVAVIRNMLEGNGYEVVGEAGSLEEVKSVVSETRPDLVTMDMTLPGTDGLECTRAIHEIDKTIKVIIISSMMDDEILLEAKRNNVSGYIQKPIDEGELIASIQRISDSDELFQTLEAESFTVFQECLADGVNRMTKTLLKVRESYPCEKEFESAGLTVIIGIIGKFAGRMLIDLSKETATKMAAVFLRREPKNQDEVIAALSEFANIVSGNACSVLNKKNKAFSLRVAPPSILHGENVYISAPGYHTTTALTDSDYGQILINSGFYRGEERWM